MVIYISIFTSEDPAQLVRTYSNNDFLDLIALAKTLFSSGNLIGVREGITTAIALLSKGFIRVAGVGDFVNAPAANSSEATACDKSDLAVPGKSFCPEVFDRSEDGGVYLTRASSFPSNSFRGRPGFLEVFVRSDQDVTVAAFGGNAVPIYKVFVRPSGNLSRLSHSLISLGALSKSLILYQMLNLGPQPSYLTKYSTYQPIPRRDYRLLISFSITQILMLPSIVTTIGYKGRSYLYRLLPRQGSRYTIKITRYTF